MGAELLVVLAIIGLLAALLFPAFKRMEERASQTNCNSNLKQIGVALHLYHDVEHRLPLGSKNGKQTLPLSAPRITLGADEDRFRSN